MNYQLNTIRLRATTNSELVFYWRMGKKMLTLPIMDIAHHTHTVLDFIHKTHLSDIPSEVKARARYLLMDIIGVAVVGSETPTARIITDYVLAQMSAGEGCPSAPLLFDGRRVSPAGAALAGGMMIDSLDAHDGQKLT